MGWERRGGQLYCYQADRVGGRVVKRYVGQGPPAELAEALRELVRQQREDARIAEEARRKAIDALDAPVSRLDAIADLVAEAALLAAGYRRHNRGEWRKRRGGPDKTGPETGGRP